jgi:energy-coupling factor transport system permease protein
MIDTDRLHWGRNLAGSSPWHRLDPRVRLLASLVLSALALASRSAPELSLVYLFLLGLYVCSATTAQTAWRGFRPFLVLLAFTAVLQLFFTPGTPLLLLGKSVPYVSYEGAALSLEILLRLAAVILVSTHLVSTTSPLELARSLGWFFSPLRKVGLPVADLVLVLNLGFQFFPIILEESRSLRLSLESRGISFRHPRLQLRFRALTAWILAVLTAVLERSQRLAVALEAKNFGKGSLLRLRFPAWAAVSTVALFITAAAAALWGLARLCVS